MATAIFGDFYPCPSKAALHVAFVGKHLNNIPTPAAILDRAVVRRNCDQMLQACETFKMSFRPHVKTHKTLEVTRLQVGDSNCMARVVVSTLAEAEHLVKFRSIWTNNPERKINILYGIPLPPSQAARLAHLAQICGGGALSLLIDHPSQLHCVKTIHDISRDRLDLFLKIDTGYHRAGIAAESPELKSIIYRILSPLQNPGYARLRGFYSHAGHSYGHNTALEAVQLLQQEIEGLEIAANTANEIARDLCLPDSGFILSVGATPTATSIQNASEEQRQSSPLNDQVSKIRTVIERVHQSHEVELHAGVYSLLDLQQLATHASPSPLGSELHTADIALTILAEVASVYPKRENSEALLAAGTLALGREPCKSYLGWGKVTPWNTKTAHNGQNSGWMVGRISQEHAILTKDNDMDDQVELHVGQKLRIWPNHACIAGAGYGWYLVVDSGLPEDQRDNVVDVWVRCRGW